MIILLDDLRHDVLNDRGFVGPLRRARARVALLDECGGLLELAQGVPLERPAELVRAVEFEQEVGIDGAREGDSLPLHVLDRGQVVFGQGETGRLRSWGGRSWCGADRWARREQLIASTHQRGEGAVVR